MLSQRCLRLQTDLVDQLLPELLQLVQNGPVNFNNSKQLDTLLRHLELSTLVKTFNVVPSTTILHILFTLAIRAPSLNWSRGTNHLETFATSEYMKQVNRRYDSFLYRTLLQKRSVKVLQNYILLMDRESSIATSMLYERFAEVVGSFFTASHQRPSIARQTKGNNRTTNNIANTLRSDSPSVYAVEVISDSEESDAILEEDHSLLLPDSPNMAERTVLSLTELGNRTSGLGETAVLFRDMPHLLAQVTPEPFDSEEPKPKRQKTLLLDQIQVFDDYLLFKRLQGSHQYNFWNLVRWCFWCADLSSQYQEFLFNSNQTKVHEIFNSYNDTLTLILQFCLLDTKNRKEKSGCHAEWLFNSLGLGISVYDRAIEFIFTGLGILSNDEPKPYFSREKILVKTDLSTHLSQCKERSLLDDNTTSMRLRLTLLECLYSVDFNVADKEDIVPRLLLEKVKLLSSTNLRKFLNASLDQGSLEQFSDDFSSESRNKMLLTMCVLFIEKISDTKVCGEKTCSGEEVLLVLSNGDILINFIKNSIMERFDDFFELWKKLIFLFSWIVEYASSLYIDLPLETVEKSLLQFSKVKIEIQSLLSKDKQILNVEDPESLEPGEEFFTPRLDHFEEYINVEDSLEVTSDSSKYAKTDDEDDTDLSVVEVKHIWSNNEAASCLALYEKYLCTQ